MRIVNTGRVLQTAAVAAAVENGSLHLFSLLSALNRHRKGDWGEIGKDDSAANNDAYDSRDGSRLFSSYVVAINGKAGKLWIITDDPFGEPNTTILFPEDY